MSEKLPSQYLTDMQQDVVKAVFKTFENTVYVEAVRLSFTHFSFFHIFHRPAFRNAVTSRHKAVYDLT